MTSNNLPVESSIPPKTSGKDPISSPLLPMQRRRTLWWVASILCTLIVIAATVLFYLFLPSKTTLYSSDVRPVTVLGIDAIEQLAAENPEMFPRGNWPGWRGFNGQGIAPVGKPPVKFGPDQTENILWKTTVSGKGYSSPVIWGNRLFLTTEINKVLWIYCYDRSTGESLWQKEVGPALGSTHSQNGHASSTPVTDGEHLFTFFGATGLFCHTVDGELVWKVELSNLYQMHGLASSPMLYRDTVIQLCDNGSDSFIAAYDKATGKEVWKTPRPSGGGWSTPVLAEYSGREELIVNGGCPAFLLPGKVLAYDPQTGKELWKCTGPNMWGIPTPLLAGETAYILCGRNCDVEAIRLGGSGDVSATHLLWSRSRTSPYVPSGVLYRNRLYIPGDNHRITCLNPGNGEVVFEQKIDGSCYASLLAADGRIYGLTMGGTGYVLEAGDTGKILHQTDFDETCFASPAVVDNDLFVRTETTLYCFREKR